MYRIVLQSPTVPNRIPTLQFIQDKDVIFETEDMQEALERFEKELDNYEKSKLRLIRVVDVILHLEGIDVCPNCGNNGNLPTYDPDVPLEGAYSYNNLADKPKINSVMLKNDKTAKDLHLQDEMEEYTNEEIDKLLSIQG